VPVGATTTEFQAGCTEAELADALSLCRRYMGEDCQSSWFESESLRPVQVGHFALDATEVTNTAFAAFVKKTGYRTRAEKKGSSDRGAPGTNLSWRTPTRQGDSYASLPKHPVVHVSRKDAMAYCESQGKRLPTEDEWEFAARGTERLVFPWGNEWDESKANWGERNQGALPVGSFAKGDTPTGYKDLAGNVWEWTASDEGNRAVLKGGSWWDFNPAALRGAARMIEDPTYTSSDIGFRCARDL